MEINLKPEVSVIIPNWNGKLFIVPCLSSLKQQTYQNFEVLLVDNHSIDNSIELATQCYPGIKIVQLNENQGFSGAVNAGIKLSQGKLIALLNNDTEAHPQWLENIVSAIHSRTDISFATSKIILMKDKKSIDSCGDAYSWYGIPYPIGRDHEDNGQYDENRVVFSACAGAAIYKRELFQKIGLFDEDFFAYYEDVDLSFRAQIAGFKCLYVANAVVYHVGRGTAQSDRSQFLHFHSYKNRVLVIIKNVPLPLFFRNIHKFIFGIFYTVLYSVKHREMLTLLRAWIAVGKLAWKKIKERKQIQSKKNVDNAYLSAMIEAQFPPVTRYFKFLQE